MRDTKKAADKSSGKELKYHEHYSAAWAAYCLAVEFRALDKDPSEAAEHLEGAAEQGRVPAAKSL